MKLIVVLCGLFILLVLSSRQNVIGWTWPGGEDVTPHPPPVLVELRGAVGAASAPPSLSTAFRSGAFSSGASISGSAAAANSCESSTASASASVRTAVTCRNISSPVTVTEKKLAAAEQDARSDQRSTVYRSRRPTTRASRTGRGSRRETRAGRTWAPRRMPLSRVGSSRRSP